MEKKKTIVNENDLTSNVAEIKLNYSTLIKPSKRPTITDSERAFQILRNSWEEETVELYEVFKVMLLNRANRVLGIVSISTGAMSGTLVDLKLIFSSALLAAASGVILAHNHPSGNLNPSNADKQLTNKIVNASKLLDIQILDHIILSQERDRYYSFADMGLI